MELDAQYNGTKCKGQIYKGRVNTFVNRKGEVIQKKVLVPLKRRSCKGCRYCGDYKSFLCEDIDLNEGVYFHNFKEIEKDQIYKLGMFNAEIDCEYGIVDNWDIGFEKILEKCEE